MKVTVSRIYLAPKTFDFRMSVGQVSKTFHRPFKQSDEKHFFDDAGGNFPCVGVSGEKIDELKLNTRMRFGLNAWIRIFKFSIVRIKMLIDLLFLLRFGLLIFTTLQFVFYIDKLYLFTAYFCLFSDHPRVIFIIHR